MLAGRPTQAQNQGYEFSHPNIHLNDKLLENVMAQSEDLELQDLCDMRQQQNIQEECQWRSNIEGIAKARELEPDQWFIPMNTFKQRCMY